MLLEPVDAKHNTRQLTAEEAATLGYVGKAVEPDQLIAEAVRMVRERSSIDRTIQHPEQQRQIAEYRRELETLSSDAEFQSWIEAQESRGRGELAKRIVSLVQTALTQGVQAADERTIELVGEAFASTPAQSTVRDFLASQGAHLEAALADLSRVQQLLASLKTHLVSTDAQNPADLGTFVVSKEPAIERAREALSTGQYDQLQNIFTELARKPTLTQEELSPIEQLFLAALAQTKRFHELRQEAGRIMRDTPLAKEEDGRAGLRRVLSQMMVDEHVLLVPAALTTQTRETVAGYLESLTRRQETLATSLTTEEMEGFVHGAIQTKGAP